MSLMPALSSQLSFDEACELVVEYLAKNVPLALWSVGRVEHGRQVHLAVRDEVYGTAAGDPVPWAGLVLPDVESGPAPRVTPIGAVIGLPIHSRDGTLFATLSGLDPVVTPTAMREQLPLLQTLAALLGQILDAEQLHAQSVERESRLQWSAFHDQLTGLPNRAMFLDRVAHSLDLHHRHQRPFALLLFDLDDFTAVNDTYGQAAGDELLVRTAERIRATLRAGDTLARLSGDEFAVLLEGGGDPREIADRLLCALREPFLIAGTIIPVTASIGVAQLPPGDTPAPASIDAVLADADVAMHTAKRAGKARFRLHDATMTLPGTHDLRLREPLRAAIASGAVRAVYQPVVGLRTGRVSGFETLARWEHEGASIGPEVFVPVATRCGLLPELTTHMLEQACAQLARWNERLGHRDLRVGVNVPPVHFADETFPDQIADHIRRHGLVPEQLVLEITEEAVLSDVATSRDVAQRLHRIGVELSLDDFGTGYSALTLLQQIPLRSLKIDRSFSADLDRGPETTRLMRSLLTLGHDLGLLVIVEGVERASQAEILHELGVELAQGYFYGRPLPAADITV